MCKSSKTGMFIALDINLININWINTSVLWILKINLGSTQYPHTQTSFFGPMWSLIPSFWERKKINLDSFHLGVGMTSRARSWHSPFKHSHTHFYRLYQRRPLCNQGAGRSFCNIPWVQIKTSLCKPQKWSITLSPFSPSECCCFTGHGFNSHNTPLSQFKNTTNNELPNYRITLISWEHSVQRKHLLPSTFTKSILNKP